jgi:hypothetical protein
MKSIIILLLGFSLYGQKIHHHMLSTQGTSKHLSKGIIVSQTIGQQSVIGNYRKNRLAVGQGYQQNIFDGSYTHNSQKVIITIAYPNPIINFINFKFSSKINGPIKVSIYDFLGRLVFHEEKKAIHNVLTIDDIYLSGGEYLVKLIAENYSYTTKILMK